MAVDPLFFLTDRPGVGPRSGATPEIVRRRAAAGHEAARARPAEDPHRPHPCATRPIRVAVDRRGRGCGRGGLRPRPRAGRPQAATPVRRARRRATPTSPISPEPNSQPAAGRGTGATDVKKSDAGTSFGYPVVEFQG